jgi:hypothetical protein
MSTLSSPSDNDAVSVGSLLNGVGQLLSSRSNTGPSSVTSEPSLASGSPALHPMDDFPTPRIRETSGDEKLASRELQAPVPSDFPGKKPERSAKRIVKGDFEMKDHFYERCCITCAIERANVVNAQIHPTVAGFFNLNRERMVQRYCHLHPAVSEEDLTAYLKYRPAHFHWAGSDLFVVTNANGLRQSIIIETNSCPSGQKSMPLLQDTDDYGGYRKVLVSSFFVNG